MKKLFLSAALLAFPAFGQLFGPVADAPQHLIVVGVGAGPTTSDVSIVGGFGELLNARSGTYSYTGVSAVPALVSVPGKGKTVNIVTAVTTGFKQILYQKGKFTLAADVSAGASLPSTATGAFNFSAVGGLDTAWHLKGSNYIGAEVKWTGLSGSVGGTLTSLGIGFIHSF